jgi:hypothetical protein
MTTTGLNTAAVVRITSSAPTLVLIGASQSLTYQLVSQVEDVDGNIIDPQPTVYYDVVAGYDVATVDDDGLVTATGAGQVVIQSSAAAFGATPGAFTPSGIPATGVIYAEQSVQVVQGVPLYPDFSFTISSDTVTLGSTDQQVITITQTALNGLTNPVTYFFSVNLGGSGIGNGYQTSFIAGRATITGSGTATIKFSTYAALPGTLTGYVNGFAGSQAYALPPGQNGLSHLQPLTIVVTG